MDKQYQVLLHIGLPKTATTSLQNNVCMALHKEGKINFLGWKIIGGGGGANYNPFANIFKQITARKLNSDEVYQLQKECQDLLILDKINVLSIENLSSSVLYNIDMVLANLSQIFKPIKPKIVTSLRSPVEFLFAFYVEVYYWSFVNQEKYNSFEKFSSCLLKDTTASIYTMFFFQRYLALIDDYFADKTVILFEDLKHDPSNYFAIWADLLSISAAEMRDKFLIKQEKMSRKIKQGKLSKPVTDEHVRHVFISQRPFWQKIIKYYRLYLPKSLENASELLSLKIKQKFYGTAHTYPSTKLHSKLSAALNIKDGQAFAQQHNLDAGKLFKYGYFAKSSSAVTD